MRQIKLKTMLSANYANCDQTDQSDQTYLGNQNEWVDQTDLGVLTDRRIEYEMGGARTVKHAKLTISRHKIISARDASENGSKILAKIQRFAKSGSLW